jgi:hypothetical protein
MTRPLPSALALPNGVPQVLKPYSAREAMSTAEAEIEADRSQRTVRVWCLRYELGRRIEGRWAVSRVALAMFLDGNEEALSRYLCGDRTSPSVVAYFTRLDIPILSPLASNVCALPMWGRAGR